MGHLAAVEHRGGGDAESASAGPDDHADLVLLHKAPGRVDHVLLAGAAVVHDDFHGPAEDSACGVDLRYGNLHRFHFRHAVSGKVTRYRGYFTDPDRIRRTGGHGKKTHQEHQRHRFPNAAETPHSSNLLT